MAADDGPRYDAAVVSRLLHIVVAALVVVGLFVPNSAWAGTVGGAETPTRVFNYADSPGAGGSTSSTGELRLGNGAFSYEIASHSTPAARG